MTQNRFNNEIIDFIYNIDVLTYFSTSLQCGIGFTNYQKTRKTTSISSEALLNYIKDIWKIISKIKREKITKPFITFFLHFCFL